MWIERLTALTRMQIQPCMASQNFGFATTAATASKRWRQLERVGRPGSSDENRQGSRLPVRAAKNWRRKQKSRRPCAVAAAFVAELRRASKPGRAFFARQGSISRKSGRFGVSIPHLEKRRATLPRCTNFPQSSALFAAGHACICSNTQHA